MSAQLTSSRVFVFLLLLSLSGALCTALPLHGQSLAEVVVFAGNYEDHGDKLGLELLFTIRNAQGQPIPDAEVERASLHFIEPQRPPTVAQRVSRANTRILITLLLDTSGSMLPALESVKTVARAAIDSAPPNALISVVRFSDAAQLLVDFSGDRLLVQNAIGNIANPRGNTCLYDTVYSALEELERISAAQDAFARKAVILFTDGKDLRLETNSPCSVHTLNDVIRRAREYEVPVNTIGLYVNPEDVNQAELVRLAEDTGAYSAVGNQSQLGDLFERIFTGLNSQYSASFETYASAGGNQAFLEVKRRGRADSLYSAPFVFLSPREFAEATPTPPPTATRPPPTPVPPTFTLLPTATSIPFFEMHGIDPVDDSFLASVSIDRPDEVASVLFTVQDDNNLNILKDQEVVVKSRPLVTYEIEKRYLKEGREYKVIVQALNQTGQYIMKVDEFSRSQTSTLAEKTFKYELPPPISVDARLQGVKTDFEKDTITLSLDTTQPKQLDDYLGVIIEADTGLEVARFGLIPFPPQFDPTAERVTVPLVIPMPAALKERRAKADATNDGAEYLLKLRLITKNDEPIDLEPINFKVIPPTPPGLLQRTWDALTGTPLILAALFAIIMSVLLWAALGRRNKRPIYRLPHSPEEYTVIGGAGGRPGARRAKLVVKVIQTPAPSDNRQATIKHFPCTIGRSSECQIRFTGDTQISRRHAQIALSDGEFTIVDLGSDNGTEVDGVRLQPNTPHKLHDAQSVMIGRQTKLEIQIHYGG